MFPGYVTIYKDIEGYIHLYFFKGITDNSTNFYKDLNLSDCPIQYQCTTISDGAIDYKFNSKRIIKIICKLIDINNKEHNISLSI